MPSTNINSSAPRLTTGVFSSRSDEWYTPAALLDGLARKYAHGAFALDAAATAESAKAPKFYDAATDALKQDWHADAHAGSVWLNPPYSAIAPFFAKAVETAAQGTTVVCLVPGRIETAWCHDLVMLHATELLFIRGRVTFERPGGERAAGAPFPSIVVVFGPPAPGFPRLGVCKRDGTVSYDPDDLAAEMATEQVELGTAPQPAEAVVAAAGAEPEGHGNHVHAVAGEEPELPSTLSTLAAASGPEVSTKRRLELRGHHNVRPPVGTAKRGKRRVSNVGSTGHIPNGARPPGRA